MADFVNYLRSRMEILSLNVKTGACPNSEAFGVLSRNATDSIVNLGAGVSSLTVGEVEQLLGLIAESHLGEADRERLRALCNSKLDAQASRKQTCEYPEAYLHEDAW